MYNHELPPHTPDLMDAINHVEAGEYVRTATGEARQRVVDALESLGLIGEEQSPESIQQGIHDARWLVETGNAVQALKDHRFVEEWMLRPYLGVDYPTATVDFTTDDTILIQWNKLDGAESFDSWLGRGYMGEGGADGNRMSRDKIFEFATRETQLPPVELLIVLTDEKPLVIARNSHRAAAAILRSENIACDALRVVDAREQSK